MIRSLIPAVALVLAATLSCAAQSPDSAPPAQSDSAKPAPSSTPAASQTPAAKSPSSAPDASPEKKKPKKVWTNEEVSKIKGNISVMGETAPASSSSPASSSNPGKGPSGDASRDKQLAAYRDQLRQLRIQLEATDKKLTELRNFKGDNSSSSGGINMNQGYSMTPIADQIKQLEAKRTQIQDQIDSVESDARKNGFDPGDLR